MILFCETYNILNSNKVTTDIEVIVQVPVALKEILSHLNVRTIHKLVKPSLLRIETTL